MKLQLALDELKLEEALWLAEQVGEYIDIYEMGTPFILEEGMRAVRSFKERFPHQEILADMKIMDGGYYESGLAFQAGADYVTVLGVTDILTVKSCVKAAKQWKKQVVVDMICVEDIPAKIEKLETLGVHVLAVHTGTDQQVAGRKPIDDLKVMKKYAKKTKIAVAGGINSQNIDQYLQLRPDILIVGSGITRAKDPVLEAKLIKEAIEARKKEDLHES